MKKGKQNIASAFTAIFFILVITSCRNPTGQASLQKPYFDLTEFFDQQINLLQKDSLVVLKTSMINKKSDQHQMDWTDWKREFALFLASDINKPSLIGKYSVDTTHNNPNEMKIRYSANDSSMRTRMVEVTFNNNEVRQIYIINKTSGFLSSSSENLLYQPMKAYIVKTATSNKFFGRNDFSMMGEITSKERKYF